MPMGTPAFTTNPKRIARLQENYDAGVEREKIPAAEREKYDLECLHVTPAHVNQLFTLTNEIRKKKTAAA